MRSAVRADGIVTEGGIYLAALPVDFFCTTSVSGFVTDQNDDPLEAESLSKKQHIKLLVVHRTVDMDI